MIFEEAVRSRVRSCAGEAEVAWLFHQTLVRTPVWECAGIRSCANRRILLCKEPPDTRSPPKGVAGGRSPPVYIGTVTVCYSKCLWEVKPVAKLANSGVIHRIQTQSVTNINEFVMHASRDLGISYFHGFSPHTC